MKKKKNMGIRILCALIFLGVGGSVMFAIYSLSAEDGQMSNARSEIVTEKIKEQVNTRLETTEEGIALSERIKYFVILHSPYGSDWNANIRKWQPRCIRTGYRCKHSAGKRKRKKILVKLCAYVGYFF